MLLKVQPYNYSWSEGFVEDLNNMIANQYAVDILDAITVLLQILLFLMSHHHFKRLLIQVIIMDL